MIVQLLDGRLVWLPHECSTHGIVLSKIGQKEIRVESSQVGRIIEK